MRYWFYRISLTKRQIGRIIEESADFEPESKQEFLINAFRANRKFAGKGFSYHYAFVDQLDQYVFARIGRQRIENAADGPESGFEEKREPVWHAANIVIDTSGSPHGQKVAMEKSSDVGSPSAIIRSLITQINESRIRSAWTAHVNPITESTEFWQAVEINRGKITELELKFVAPNILGGTDKTRQALRKLRDESNMEETQLKLKNRDGKLEPDTPDIREELDYIAEGGGEVKLKSGKKTLYSSGDQEPTAVDAEEALDKAINNEEKSFLRKLADFLFKRD